ncbi:MAG: hypothetical protein ACXVSA_21920, partial [Solirubrobacteraceae bacterium]
RPRASTPAPSQPPAPDPADRAPALWSRRRWLRVAGAAGLAGDTVKLAVTGVAGSGAGGTGATYVADGRLVEGDLTTGLQAAISLK